MAERAPKPRPREPRTKPGYGRVTKAEIARYEAIIMERTVQPAPPPVHVEPVEVEPEQPVAPAHDEHLRQWRRDHMARKTAAPVVIPPDETTRQRKAREKAQRKAERDTAAERARIAARESELRKVGALSEAGTASAKRPLQIVNTKDGRRAEIDSFTACFPDRLDRTAARLLAWAAFAEHYSAVTAGEIKNQRYERGVDCSSSTPGHISEIRLAAIRIDIELRAWVGSGHGLMVGVIHQGQSLEQIQGDRTTFALVLDRAAAFFRVGGYRLPEGAIERMESHIEAQARASQRHYTPELARTMVIEDGATVRTLQNQFGLTYREAYTIHANIRGAKTETLTQWDDQATARAKRGKPYLG